MKPFDIRLLRVGRSARTVLGVGAMFGAVRAVAIIAWSWCLAHALAAVALPVLGGLGGASGLIGDGAFELDHLPWLLCGALGAVVLRSAAGWAVDLLAARGAIQVKTELRRAALDAIDRRSPEWVKGHPDVVPTTALGRGLDALDGYFSGYLPQLILTAVSTPLLVLAVIWADSLSGIIVVLVFPVIPLFMILIGFATQAVQDRQWAQLERLSASFLDVITGLPTLKIYRRERKQVARIARETDEYRSRTMRVLRVTFLSGFVLDLAGTFSIALVAVTVGTRLVVGEFPLALGLFVLLLLPEVFVPIRQVGAAFHASTEGLSAAQRIFDLIEAPDSATEPGPVLASAAPDAAAGGRSIVLRDAVVFRDAGCTVGPISLRVEPGEVVALEGPSGSGKSTLIAAILGFCALDSGELLRPATVSWAGQQPGLVQGSVSENVALGCEVLDERRVRRALDLVGLERIDASTQLGALGAGVSGGQAQRIAIARCLYRAWDRDAGALLLDEPSSALDVENERRVAAALRAEADAGRAVLIVSHRQRLIDAADRTVRVGATALISREVGDE